MKGKLIKFDVFIVIILITFLTTVFLLSFTSAKSFDPLSCSFIENATSCEDLYYKCGTQATQIVIDANFGLAEELKECMKPIERKNTIDRIITIISICIAIVALLMVNYFRRKLYK